MSRPDLDNLAGTADEFIGFPAYFDQATTDPSQTPAGGRTAATDLTGCGCLRQQAAPPAGPTDTSAWFDETVRAKASDLNADRMHAAVEALNRVRLLMEAPAIQHTPGDWRARMDAVLDEAPR